MASLVAALGSRSVRIGAQSSHLYAEAIWRFDAQAQRWEAFFVGGPPFLNTLGRVAPGDALFIRIVPGVRVDWTTVDLEPADARGFVTIEPGWNAVPFAGPDGTAVGLLVDGAAGIQSAFLLEPETQRWLGYHPGQPDIVNEFESVDRLQVLWVLSDAAEPFELTLPVAP